MIGGERWRVPVPGMRKLIPGGLLLASLLTPFAALADEPSLTFNGYATFGLLHSSEERADYIPNPLRSRGAGRSGNPNVETDSLAALQIDYQTGSRLSATVQLVAEQDYRRDFRPRLEWANLQYSISDDVEIRVGRIALNTFMVSDYRKVGFALPWVRPPAELYQLAGFSNSDGVDITYHFSQAGFNYSGQIVYGRNRLTETAGDVEVPNLWGLFQRLERGPLTVHTSYLSPKVLFGRAEPLWEAYRAFGPAGEAVVTDYDAAGRRSSFQVYGFAWDPGDWFAQAEWGRGDTASGFGDRVGWYASTGIRLGDWTPYLTYARTEGRQRDVRGLEPGQFDPALTPVIDELNNTLFLLQSGTSPQQHTVSAGARWDFRPGMSAKLQYDRISVRDGSIGLFRNLSDSRYRPDGADIFSLSLDVLF